MNTRQKFEFDNSSRCPQSAVKDGKYNPAYAEWFEKEYIPELEKIHTQKVKDLEETRDVYSNKLIEAGSKQGTLKAKNKDLEDKLSNTVYWLNVAKDPYKAPEQREVAIQQAILEATK